MPLKPLLKNKLQILKHYSGLNEQAIDRWPFWQYEENITIINELVDEEEQAQKKQQEEQGQSMPNFNPSSYMNQMNSMASKFK